MKKHPIAFKILGILGGGLAGFWYWKVHGCTAGCAITGTWYGSVMLGSVLGNLLEGMIVDFTKKEIK